jgi:aryl-alcohol dehydrogenase-like predicted oxidoreductase
VRHIGCSELSASQIQASLELPDVERFTTNQPQYSILRRRIEADVIPVCVANSISQVVFSPLGQGVLTGKYRRGERPPEGHVRPQTA